MKTNHKHYKQPLTEDPPLIRRRDAQFKTGKYAALIIGIFLVCVVIMFLGLMYG